MEYQPLSKLFYSDKEHYEEIYHKRFSSEYATHIDFEISGYPAFFVLDPSLHNQMINIYRTDKRIRELSNKLPGIAIQQFTMRSLVDEIVLTNDIEGVYSSRREINSILSELQIKSEEKGKRFRGLVQKYIMLQNNGDITINSCQDIRELYNDLVYAEIEEDNPHNLPDGEIFRKDSVSVESSAQKEIHRGVYPESKIIECMEKALKILDADGIDELAKTALFHYLFGYIHPFYDGNGRTSRFISSYLLSKEFESAIAYRLSYTIKENIKAYYQAFRTCNDKNNRGDLTPFVILFTGIVEESMNQLEEALKKRYYWLMHYKAMVQYLPYGLSDKYLDLYDYLIQASLFSEMGISTQELLDLMHIGRTTLSKRLDSLSEHGLLVKKPFGHLRFYKLNLEEADRLAPSE